MLEDWLGRPVEVRIPAPSSPDLGYNLAARADGVTFLLMVKATDDLASLGRFVARVPDSGPDAVPVLVVPYMGPKAREYLRARGLSWLDLSGNADIRGAGTRILVEGKPNRFSSPGRSSTAFSPKAARLSRALLVAPERWWLQKDLVAVTGLTAGYVSKVVARLLEDGLVVRRTEDGRLRPASPGLLLDGWAQVYRFANSDVGRFHAVGRNGEIVLREVAGRLSERRGVEWAATGLGAAWLLTGHADFRLTTFFVSTPLLDVEPLGLRPVERGENVWLVVPRDEGVFYAAEEVSGLRCVHPVQAYLDLLGHPERAREAAAELRAQKLGWAA